MGKTMTVATLVVAGIAAVFGLGGLLVAAAAASLIGAGLWLFAKGAKWM